MLLCNTLHISFNGKRIHLRSRLFLPLEHDFSSCSKLLEWQSCQAWSFPRCKCAFSHPRSSVQERSSWWSLSPSSRDLGIWGSRRVRAAQKKICLHLTFRWGSTCHQRRLSCCWPSFLWWRGSSRRRWAFQPKKSDVKQTLLNFLKVEHFLKEENLPLEEWTLLPEHSFSSSVLQEVCQITEVSPTI